MVTLKKHGRAGSENAPTDPIQSPTNFNPEKWLKAAEFVPGQLWKGSGKYSVLNGWELSCLRPSNVIRDVQSDVHRHVLFQASALYK